MSALGGIEPPLTVPKTIALPLGYNANLPRCADPVASSLVRLKIQHTSCLSPCELLNVSSRIRGIPFLSGDDILPFCANSRTHIYLLVFQHSVSLAAIREGANLLTPHRMALVLSFQTDYLTYCLPPALVCDGGCFRDLESSLTQACIEGPLLAQLRRSPCFRCIAALILMTLYRH